jgi:hypothetical protein
MSAAAHVIAVGLEDHLNEAIRAWFSQFNHLPPLPLVSTKVDVIAPGDATFAGLISMMAASPAKNFILIVHGHADGSGLYLKLTPNQAKPHTTFMDLSRLIRLAEQGGTLDQRDRRAMGATQAEALDLLAQRKNLLAKKIDCIEFRACNLGRNRVSLDGFRRFLGARRAGAPDVHSFFGIVPAVTNPDLLRRHAREHTGLGHWETYKFPSAFKTPELVACFALNDLQKPEYGGHIVAGEPGVLNAWIRRHIMASGGSPAGRRMAMHGLWVSDIPIHEKGQPVRYVPAAVDIDSEQAASPLGGWGGPDVRRFIPPLSELYAKHIVYAQ